MCPRKTTWPWSISIRADGAAPDPLFSQPVSPRKNAPDAFVWVLREHGTFLWDEPYPYSLVTLRYPHGDKTHFYTFSNRQLKEVNVDEAAKFLTYELWGGLFADEAAKWGWLKEQPGFRNKHTDRFLTVGQMEEFISRGEVPPTHAYQSAVRVFSRTFL